MPRQSRIDAPGALHHVMIRGIDRTVIFRNDEDRESFLVPTIAKARAVLCYLGLTSVSIATELGISQSAVNRAIARAPEVLQREEINGERLEYQ